VGGRWIHDLTRPSDLGTGKRVHSDSFELAERRISDCRRRRDRATRSYKRKLKHDTRNMICGAHDDRCIHAALDRISRYTYMKLVKIDKLTGLFRVRRIFAIRRDFYANKTLAIKRAHINIHTLTTYISVKI
jgi:hypothetical protein